MSADTKQRTKGPTFREWMDGLPKAKDKPKAPEPSKYHLLCGECYPRGYAGSYVGLCGVRAKSSTPGLPYTGPDPDTCQSCAVISHRRGRRPCPNADCPRRSWIGRTWRRIFGGEP